MRQYNPRKEGTPYTTAYFNGTTYQCYNINCLIDNASVEECGQLRHTNAKIYTPILRCSECNTIYFGNPTYYAEKPAIKAKAERKENGENRDIILPNILTV